MSRQKFAPAVRISPAGVLSYSTHDALVRAVGRRAADKFQMDPDSLEEGPRNECLTIVALATDVVP